MERRSVVSIISIIGLAFFLAPMIPIVVPCSKGGDGTVGYRFEGLQSPSYAIFGIESLLHVPWTVICHDPLGYRGLRVWNSCFRNFVNPQVEIS